MLNVPLHPAVVHVPLGIAVILPLVALGVTLALWRGRWPRSAWAMVCALQLLMTGSAWLALLSGEQEEERVERVVAEAAIERHEERAEGFLWASGLLLLPSLGVLALRREGAQRALALAVTAGTVAVAGLALWTGHSGGELVYTHGAGLPTGEGPPGGHWSSRSFDDDDD